MMESDMHKPLWKRRHFNVLAFSAVLAGFYTTTWAKPAPVILVVGDSISAEYGLQRGQGWVSLLEKKLQAEHKAVKVVNASISGETTAGGRSRLAPLLQQYQPSVVVIELGGNDALRGLALTQSEANLIAMAQASQAAGAKVLLLGMQVPPNYGTDYAQQFEAIFKQTAKATASRSVPLFLKGIADAADPMQGFQADRIHPNAQAQPQLLANMWPELKKLLP